LLLKNNIAACMETNPPNSQIPEPEPTSALEDILAFFKLFPTRIKTFLLFIQVKSKVLVIILFQLGSKLSKKSKPSEQSKTVDAVGDAVGETYLGLAYPGLAYPGLAYPGLAYGECPTCGRPMGHDHETHATNDEPTFPKITRKNFYKHPIFWARFLGYAIPLSFLLYVLYLNYLPFGYHKTFTINVGSPNDTTPSEFYLEPSKDLSDRLTNPDGSTYRTLNGMATAVFKPNAVLKNANITVSVKGGDGISLIPPQINFDPNSVNWDYNWDFTKGVPAGLTNDNSSAFAYEGGTYFDGTARVELPKSNNMFENGPFTVYAEWTPNDSTDDFQEIIGHYNWEILQDSNDIKFMIGRVNNANGQFYYSLYKINDSESFFKRQHNLLAIYSPDQINGSGYLLLFIDGRFISMIPITSDIIWSDYNGNNNLTFGKSGHGVANYYKGVINNVRISNNNSLPINKTIELATNDSATNITLLTKTKTYVSKVELHAIK